MSSGSHTTGVEIAYLQDVVPYGSLEVRTGPTVLVSRYLSLHTQFFTDIDLEFEFQFSNDGITWGKSTDGTGDFNLSTAVETITSRDTIGSFIRIIGTNPMAVVGTVFRSTTFGSFCDVDNGAAGGPWMRLGNDISPVLATDNVFTGAGSTFDGFNNSAISCTDCTTVGAQGNNNCFLSSNVCTTSSLRDDFKVMASCITCTWFSTSGFGGQQGFMASSVGSTHNHSRSDTILSHNAITSGGSQNRTFNLYAANSTDFTITPTGSGELNHSALISCRDLTCHAQVGHSLLHGRHISVGTIAGVPNDGSIQTGVTVLADDSATGAILEPLTDTFTCRFKAGYTFYSNDAITTGVTLAAGANAWAAVSDVTKKENVVVVDTADILARMILVPVNTYNFIGNDPAVVSIGPTAQDWHVQFGCDDMDVPVWDLVAQEAQWADDLIEDETLENGPDITARDGVNIQALDGLGDPIFQSVPAKDVLTIDTMDLTGVLMASIQELQKLIVALELRVDALEV